MMVEGGSTLVMFKYKSNQKSLITEHISYSEH